MSILIKALNVYINFLGEVRMQRYE